MLEIQPIDADAGTPPTPAHKRSSWQRLRRWPITLYVGGTLVSLFVLVALVSFVWTPYPPNDLHMTNRLAQPGTPGFSLGTDRAGRDVVTELMLGARNSLYVSVVSTVAAMLLGSMIGLAIAGSRSAVCRPLDAPRRRRAGASGHPDRPRSRRQVGARQHAPRPIAIIIWQVPVAARVTIGPARQSPRPRLTSRPPTGTGDASRT